MPLRRVLAAPHTKESVVTSGTHDFHIPRSTLAQSALATVGGCTDSNAATGSWVAENHSITSRLGIVFSPRFSLKPVPASRTATNAP